MTIDCRLDINTRITDVKTLVSVSLTDRQSSYNVFVCITDFDEIFPTFKDLVTILITHSLYKSNITNKVNHEEAGQSGNLITKGAARGD